MKKAAWVIIFFLISACVEPVSFTVPVTNQLVVDGMITDQPGPYTISLGTVSDLKNDSTKVIPVGYAKITISSSVGESEDLVQTAVGIYQTTNIQGQIGRSYSIKIIVSGHVLQSDPELLTSIGDLKTVDFEFEKYVIDNNGIDTEAGRFNIFADADVNPDSKYVRWRLLGTYEILNSPANRVKYVFNGETSVAVPDPVPCSGLLTNTPCTCCVCWVSEYGLPVVSDDQLIANGVFKHVRVGTVEITPRKFTDKYYVNVQQISLTESAYNFWKIVQAQKQGASSLFQPVFGKLISNIHDTTSPAQIVSGYFGASAIKQKGIFLMRSDIPLRLKPIEEVDASCIGVNSVNVQPPFWQ